MRVVVEKVCGDAGNEYGMFFHLSPLNCLVACNLRLFLNFYFSVIQVTFLLESPLGGHWIPANSMRE